MKNRKWFRAKALADSRDPLLAALLRLLPRSAPSKPVRPASEAAATAGRDSGAEPCWTASLSRGDDLPPCRLSIPAGGGAASAMRLETFRRDAGAEGRCREI